jgi:uncharacterized protein involved in copper resistance
VLQAGLPEPTTANTSANTSANTANLERGFQVSTTVHFIPDHSDHSDHSDHFAADHFAADHFAADHVNHVAHSIPDWFPNQALSSFISNLQDR